MSNEATINALLGDEKISLDAIRAGEGKWFGQLDDEITKSWAELPDEAKVIAYLWGVRENDLNEQYLDYKWSSE